MLNAAFIDNIFSTPGISFSETALKVFDYQFRENELYREYVLAIGKDPEKVKEVQEIPFLPVSFFKSHKVVCGKFEAEKVFESSGTAQTGHSLHYIRDVEIYKQSLLETFHYFYGSPEKWCILGLLPSYLERKNASLVFMVSELIKRSGHKFSGFYLNEYRQLAIVLKELELQNQKAILLGVTFALLDFAEQYPVQLHSTIVMETGGMKGRREEWTRAEVHAFLKEKFGARNIHSEYGMTELLSQAYSKQDGVFDCPPWMKVLVRDENDPFQVSRTGKGVLNIIDLANIFSCSFIATDDAGAVYENGTFEVLGRIDNSDIRGCSLMAI